MTEPKYEDEEAHYYGGDPRMEEMGSGVAYLDQDSIGIRTEAGTLIWPKAHLLGIAYVPTVPLPDLRDYLPEMQQDIVLASEDYPPEPAISLRIKDPEGVYAEGFDVRIGFRNEYHALVFVKRAQTILGLGPPIAKQ